MKAQYLCLKQPESSFNLRIFRPIACIVVGLLLQSCGNKGDLYLPELTLSEEQKNILNELDGELNNGVDDELGSDTSNALQKPAVAPQNELDESGSEPATNPLTVPGDVPAEDPAAKKKKTNTPVNQ